MMPTLFEMIEALRTHYGQEQYVAEVSRRRLDPAGVIRNEFTIIKRERDCIEEMYEELQKTSEDKPGDIKDKLCPKCGYSLVNGGPGYDFCSNEECGYTHKQLQKTKVMDELIAAAHGALFEMCSTPAPSNSFTDAVDRLDAAVSKYESSKEGQ